MGTPWWRRVLIGLLLAGLFYALGRSFYLNAVFATTLPRKPDPASGRVHAITVQHGTHVFASDEDMRTLNGTQRDIMLGGIAGLTAGLLYAIPRRGKRQPL